MSAIGQLSNLILLEIIFGQFIYNPIELKLHHMLETSHIWEHIYKVKSKVFHNDYMGNVFTGNLYRSENMKAFLLKSEIILR